MGTSRYEELKSDWDLLRRYDGEMSYVKFIDSLGKMASHAERRIRKDIITKKLDEYEQSRADPTEKDDR